MNNPNKYKVYLSIAGVSNTWIIGKIAEDIKFHLEKNGIICDYGSPDNYSKQEICYHLGYAYAKPKIDAKVNSVFVTHVDDKIKENMLVNLKDMFDSFICMSKEDSIFLEQLGFDPSKVFGITLPIRNNYVKPLSIGIFSAWYPDGRKNDEWLLRFCRKYEASRIVNFVFIGPNWGSFIDKLVDLNCSFEWHNVDSKMPYEYQFQQLKLEKLDYYFYLGMDGGAMGSYDAYSFAVPLLITDDGYHKEIPKIDYPFATYDDFENKLYNIISDHIKRLEFFKNNNAANYTDKLWDIWNNNYIDDIIDKDFDDVLKKRRDNYFSSSLIRSLGGIKRRIYKFLH